jgi:hypothetical protein
MVAGANSYRQINEFIRIHLLRFTDAVDLKQRYSLSYTGLRVILRGVHPMPLEAAFGMSADATG